MIKRNGQTLPWTTTAFFDALDAAETMKTVFGIDDVATVVDGSKSEIIAAFDKLQAKADNFENANHAHETLFVSVVWIGHTWD